MRDLGRVLGPALGAALMLASGHAMAQSGPGQMLSPPPPGQVSDGTEAGLPPFDEDIPLPEPVASPPSESESATTTAPAGTGGAQASPSPAAPETDAARRVIVIDAATYAIDPIVGKHVTHRMRATIADMGYEVLSPEESVTAAQSMSMPYPPAPADLWRVTWVARAQRGAFARVWAFHGQYVIEIAVASLDGAGPFFARGAAGSHDLHAVVEALTRQAMPMPTSWLAEEARRLAAGVSAPIEQPQEPSFEAPPMIEHPPGAEGAEPSTPEEPEEPLRRVSIALQTEGAIGVSSDSFYNHMVGGRLDVRLTRNLIIGAYLAYVNLEGREGRVGNLLAYAQIENRIRLSSKTDVNFPLRFGAGYLPFNGPVIRIAAGVNIPLGKVVELGFDLISPTFWILSERVAVSMDIAGELIFRL